MNITDFQAKILELPIQEQNFVLNQLDSLLSDLEVNIPQIQQEIKSTESRPCPNCQGINSIKTGALKGIQRYKCKDCGKYYRTSTGSFNAGLHKGKGLILKTYLKSFLAGDSIRKSAILCGISIPTSFTWRHRILAALEKQQNQTTLTGIVESDEIFIPYSEKGKRNINDRVIRKRGKSKLIKKKRGINDDKVAVIVSHDRKGNKALQVAKRGRITEENLNNALKNKITSDSILCSDGHHSYVAFAKNNELEHKIVKANNNEFVKEGKYHIQTVNNTAKDFTHWLDGFNGVATKYLQNYLNWYAILKKLEKNGIPAKLLATMICSSFEAIKILQKINDKSFA